MSVPKTSAAAVLVEYEKPLEVQEIRIPELEPNAVLVQVEASTMCGTDVHMQRGRFPSFAKLPLVMGHEIVGRVVALGRDRRRDANDAELREGDLVVWSYAWCGHCFWCSVSRQPTLCANSRMYGWGSAAEFPHLTGGFSEYAYVMPECSVLKVPDGVDARVAASATCAFRTVIHGYERFGRIEPYETVVVQGSGPVGLYALAYAVQQGAARVVCFGAPDARIEVAKRWGATHTFNVETTSVEERRQALFDLTDGRGPDVVVECSGVQAALAEGFDMIRKGGRYLVIGQASAEPMPLRGSDFNHRQLQVTGNLSGDIPHYYRAMRFLADFGHRFNFEDLLGGSYGLDSVDDALASMGAQREIKPVILPNG